MPKSCKQQQGQQSYTEPYQRRNMEPVTHRDTGSFETCKYDITQTRNHKKSTTMSSDVLLLQTYTHTHTHKAKTYPRLNRTHSYQLESRVMGGLETVKMRMKSGIRAARTSSPAWPRWFNDIGWQLKIKQEVLVKKTPKTSINNWFITEYSGEKNKMTNLI